ncbi:TPA: 2Fe-2S iron-sulfur cluster-binding protein [Pseudomonas aeruginosa]
MSVFNRFRLYHWLLAGLFVATYLSGDSAETLHVWLGYGLLALLGVRLLAWLGKARGFPRLLAPRGIPGAAKARLGKGLTATLLASLAACCLLGWLLIDNVEFLNSTLPLGLSDAWKLNGLDGENLPGDPAEIHEFLANLALWLLFAHLGFLLLFARQPAWKMLAVRRSPRGDGGQLRLRVRAVHEETADSRSFELVSATPGRPLPSYRAGQFLRIQVACANPLLWRCYSLSSAPGLDDCLRITIKRVAGGRASNWLLDNLKVGMSLSAQAPAGTFVRPAGSTEVLLLAAGSGITPVYSILRDLLENGGGNARLLYLNQSLASSIFATRLQALQQRHAQRFTLQNRFNDEHGRAERQDLLCLLRRWSGEEVFICGPAAFMDLAEECLTELGAPPERIHTERFAAPRFALSPAGEATHGIRVELEGRSLHVDGYADELLLDSLERAGLQPPSGCRSGSCGTCRCWVESGEIHLRNNQVLSHTEIEQGWTLACQTEVRGKFVYVRF